MKLGRFNECEVVAGHTGLGRVVENITVMEVPEIVPWLKGKELLLTTLYVIKDDPDAQKVLVQKLHSSGVSGLAIKPSHFIGEIPQEIIDSGNRLGFPIIKIPHDIKYLDILTPVNHYIFNQKVVLAEDLEQAAKMLHEISLGSQGVDVFIDNVSNLTKNLVTIESEFSYIQIPELPEHISPLTKDQMYELSILKRPIRCQRSMNEESVSCIISPIMIDGTYYGNITCWEMDSDHLSIDIAILEKASSLLSLEFLRQKVKYEMEQQYKNDFVRELLYSDNIKEKNVIEWGASYRITKDTDYCCMLLRMKSNDRKVNPQEKLKDSKIIIMIEKMIPEGLVGYIRNGICLILPDAKAEEHIEKKLYAAISSYIGSKYQLLMGIGRIGKGPQGIQTSYRQAEQVLNLHESSNTTQKIMHYNQLGVYRLINQVKDSQEIEDLYDETIGKLIEADAKSELLNTLESYFKHHEVLNRTAEDLFIHVNTLKYRLKKIEEITGYDLKKSDGKFHLYLGLKIHRLYYVSYT